MINGLKHDAVFGSDTAKQGGNTDPAATSPDNHMTSEQLIQDLMDHATEQNDSAFPEHPSEDANARSAKPTRSLVDRLIVMPARKVANAVVFAKVAVLTYQPVPRHIALLLMVTILMIVPWLLPSLFAIALGCVAVTYLVIGHDHSVRLVMTWFGWLKRRDSRGAEVVRARAERISNRLTGWLGRLPNTWTTGLYLPDFAVVDDFSEKLKSDPFDRLTGAAQNQ